MRFLPMALCRFGFLDKFPISAIAFLCRFIWLDCKSEARTCRPLSFCTIFWLITADTCGRRNPCLSSTQQPNSICTTYNAFVCCQVLQNATAGFLRFLLLAWVEQRQVSLKCFGVDEQSCPAGIAFLSVQKVKVLLDKTQDRYWWLQGSDFWKRSILKTLKPDFCLSPLKYMIEITLSTALSPAHKLQLQKCWSDYTLTKEKLWTGEKSACGGFVISPSVLAIWPEDWSSRWGRCHPGCLSWLLVCPKTWSCWTRQELRPPAGMSGCARCTHSFPQTI